MPELPEVETVCAGLRQSIIGNKFVKVANLRPNLRIPFPADFSSKIEGRTIKSVTRRAKYILIKLDDGSIIIAHLGMSGKIIIYKNKQNQRQKHDHAIFQFNDGKEMVFNDARRFGLMTISHENEINEHKLITNLGIEPLTEEFNGEYLHELLKNKSTNIKNAIMDASLVVGVGNIYACEALFRSKINPRKTAREISSAKCQEFATNIKEILLEAIKSGGSTLRDYVQSSGDSGYFQHSFKVYGREKEACILCSNEIKRMKQSGRSTFYCENCQK